MEPKIISEAPAAPQKPIALVLEENVKKGQKIVQQIATAVWKEVTAFFERKNDLYAIGTVTVVAFTLSALFAQRLKANLATAISNSLTEEQQTTAPTAPLENHLETTTQALWVSAALGVAALFYCTIRLSHLQKGFVQANPILLGIPVSLIGTAGLIGRRLARLPESHEEKLLALHLVNSQQIRTVITNLFAVDAKEEAPAEESKRLELEHLIMETVVQQIKLLQKKGFDQETVIRQACRNAIVKLSQLEITILNSYRTPRTTSFITTLYEANLPTESTQTDLRDCPSISIERVCKLNGLISVFTQRLIEQKDLLQKALTVKPKIDTLQEASNRFAAFFRQTVKVYNDLSYSSPKSKPQANSPRGSVSSKSTATPTPRSTRSPEPASSASP